MKGSWRTTKDVSICFINYVIIKTHVIKTHWWCSLNQFAFVKWIHITCLIYHFLQPQAALFWDVSASFWFFLLIINRERDGNVFVLDTKLWIQSYGYIWTWQKFTVWKSWILLIYIVSYLHILILNNILTLPKLSLLLKLRLIWPDLCLACFLPARFMPMRASLQNQNKCNSSIQVCICIYSATIRST